MRNGSALLDPPSRIAVNCDLDSGFDSALGSDLVSQLGSDLNYAIAYLESRFAMNPHERLPTRDASSQVNPLFVLLRTRLGCLWRFREDLAGTPLRALSKLAGREGPVRLGVEDAPPPERLEPMLRVLRDAGLEVEVARDLLVYRAGTPPILKPDAARLFRVTSEADLSGLAERSRHAHMGSSHWEHVGGLLQLDACEWIRFADLFRFELCAGITE